MRDQRGRGELDYRLNGPGVADLYDSERKAVRDIAFAMRISHSFRGVTSVPEEERIKTNFTREIRNRCAEIGLIIDVEWVWEDEKTGKMSPDVSEDPSDHNLYWNPRVIITGRTDKLEEFDHDQQRFEIQTGVLEEPGFIREDGSVRDDPKRKNIY